MCCQHILFFQQEIHIVFSSTNTSRISEHKVILYFPAQICIVVEEQTCRSQLSTLLIAACTPSNMAFRNLTSACAVGKFIDIPYFQIIQHSNMAFRNLTSAYALGKIINIPYFQAFQNLTSASRSVFSSSDSPISVF